MLSRKTKIYLSIYRLFVSKNFANYKTLKSYQYNLISKIRDLIQIVVQRIKKCNFGSVFH